MTAYRSISKGSSLLIISILFLGLGIWSLWFDMLVIFKVLSLIFTLLISGVLAYTFVYYARLSREVIVIDDNVLIINKKNSNLELKLDDIKEVVFNFNVPYFALTFAFTVITQSGHTYSFGFYLSKQVGFYKFMKKTLEEKNIAISRSLYL